MGSKMPLFSRVVAAGLAVVLSLTIPVASSNAAQITDIPPRIAFQISTGSTSGTYFPVGELLAQVLSHPPGVGRCEAADVCGPAGLIVSARASEGSIANVLSVNSGQVSSGFAQSDVVAMAIAGEGPFRKTGPTRDLRIIANLYGEDMHLVASKKANIKSIADLKGKRVSLATEGSGTIITARAVLAAYRLTEKSFAPNYDPAEKAIDLLRGGTLDAMFFVGGTPVKLIQQLIEDDVAVLVPIDGDGAKRLLAREPYLSQHTIPEGVYPHSPAINTVSVDALWITGASQPDSLIYGMLRALYSQANRMAIDTQRAGAHFMDPTSGVKDATAPIHPGAIRYFTETGILKQTEKASLPPPPTPRKS
jgi:hypothetical protein